MVGISSSKELKEILDSPVQDELFEFPEGLSNIDNDLLNPSNWENL